MLTKLTDKQKETMIEVRDFWINNFINPKEIDQISLLQQVQWLYKMSDLEAPQVIITESPMASQYIGNMHTKGIKPMIALCKQITDDLYILPADAVPVNINEYDPAERIKTANYGNVTDYSWVAFYDFIEKIGYNLDNEYFDDYKKLLLCNFYDMIQMDEVCIVSKLPKFVKYDNENRLHCDDGPAIMFNDGFKLYYYQDIKLPADYIETPAEQLSSELIIKEQNAEIRHFLLSKIGTDRVLSELGSVTLDKINGITLYKKYPIGNYFQQGDVIISPNNSNKRKITFNDLNDEMKEKLNRVKYELVNLEIGENQKRPFLMMINPSTGIKHIESVSPECDTVFSAICYRNKKDCLPIKLS